MTELKDDAIREEPPGYSVKNQIYATFVVNFLILAFGVHQGWSSPAINLLTSKESPLPSCQMDMSQASWVASFDPAGALFGHLFIGYVAKHFGRKRPLHIFTIPLIFGWILVRFAQSPIYLYGARFIGGLFGSISFTILMMFQSEIANDQVRGALISTLCAANNVGYLVAYIIGSISYNAMAEFSIALIAIPAILLYFLPETPLYLVKQSKIADAQKSIRFYKNLCESNENCDKIVQQEIVKLQTTIAEDQNANDTKTSLKWSDFTTKSARKALILGVVLIGLYVWNGIYGMSAYVANIFEETGSPLSPNMSVIVLGIIQVVSICISIATVDRFGRKPLIAVSGIGVALGFTIFGVYMTLKSWNVNVDFVNWIPLASLAWVSFVCMMGIQSLPVSIIPEIMPHKIKEAAVGFCMTLNWISAFINMKFAPLLIESIGLHWYLFLFAGICLSCTLIILTFLPETKGKTYEEIMESLS